MALRSRRVDPERVVLDLNTQCDFLLQRGALPMINRAEIVPNIRRLMEWARAARVPVISSIDAHRVAEPLNGTPAHCIDNTVGQQKLPFTLLPRRILLAGDNTLDIPRDVLLRYRQVIMAKRSKDFLNNPKADRLITEVGCKYFIVFGVATELCVKSVVLGLIARHRRVVLVADAVGHWNAEDADLAIRQMSAKGTLAATTDEVVSGHEFEFPPFPEEEEAAAFQIASAVSAMARLDGVA